MAGCEKVQGQQECGGCLRSRVWSSRAVRLVRVKGFPSEPRLSSVLLDKGQGLC